MKSVTNLLLAMSLFALTACAQTNRKNSERMNNKTLVAYFSATGTTRQEATILAKAIQADLYEIKPEAEYTDADLDWQNDKSRSSAEMKDKNSRPAMKKDLKDADKYDIVFIGFPIWWYTAPTIINTFMDTYDMSGKTVYLFATSGGSTPDKALEQLRKQYPKVNFKTAKLVNGASEEELREWAAR